MTTSRQEFYNGYHIDQPPTIPTVVFSGTGGLLGNGNYLYAYSFVTQNGESSISFASAAGSPGTATGSANLSNISIGDSHVIARKIYRTPVGGAFATLAFLATINDNLTTTYHDTAADSALGALFPALSTADPIIATFGNVLTDGLITRAFKSGTGATQTTSITCNSNFMKLTYIAVTTAAASADSTFVLSNYVSPNSLVHVTIDSFGGVLGTNGFPSIVVSNIIKGSFKLNFINSHPTNALTGTYVIYCSIIN